MEDTSKSETHLRLAMYKKIILKPQTHTRKIKEPMRKEIKHQTYSWWKERTDFRKLSSNIHMQIKSIININSDTVDELFILLYINRLDNSQVTAVLKYKQNSIICPVEMRVAVAGLRSD